VLSEQELLQQGSSAKIALNDPFFDNPCKMRKCVGIHDPFCMKGEDGSPRFFFPAGAAGIK
jgi:hypothetical protein